jgi:hydrogenase nickel incorporation protein HypA/HybF
MHEVGLCEGVVAAVERRAGERPVARVGVQVGALLQVVPEAFQQSFELVAAGGVAAGAQTELTVVPVRGRCRGCGCRFTAVEAVPACPECGSVALDTTGGDELVLEWIEYREAAGQAAEGV